MNNIIHQGFRVGTKLRSMRVTEYMRPGFDTGKRHTTKGVLADSALNRKPRVSVAPPTERRDDHKI